MEVRVVLSSDEIVRGLKHYRRIAKQDVLRASETPDPDASLRHAEARRTVYAELAELAERSGPQDVVRAALERYERLPFVTGSDDPAHVEIRGHENALENFFLMIGLEPKVRREARSKRPPLGSNGTAPEAAAPEATDAAPDVDANDR
ncbi:MAG: hypothetical protein P1P87_07685 [Trueperaceae bacterium]|nr:hypothetical protein [Trueperaceae bacterium]